MEVTTLSEPQATFLWDYRLKGQKNLDNLLSSVYEAHRIMRMRNSVEPEPEVYIQ